MVSLIVIDDLRVVIRGVDGLWLLIVDAYWCLLRVWLLRCEVDRRRWWLKLHGLRPPDFHPCVGLIWRCRITGKQFEDVIIDNYLAEVDVFPAVGTLPGCLKPSHALPADGVVHGADDDRLLLSAVVLRVADVAFVDGVLELFCKTATVGHLTI